MTFADYDAKIAVFDENDEFSEGFIFDKKWYLLEKM